MNLSNRNIPRWVEILLGVIFIWFGILALNRPGQTLGFLVLWFGFLAIFRGVALFINTLLYGREAGGGSIIINLIMSVIDFGVGILLVTNLYKGVVVLGVLFAFWFIVDSLSNLFNVQKYRGKNIFWKLLLVIFNLISLALGVMLLLNPVVSAVAIPILIGIYSISFGLMSIMFAFRHKNKTDEISE